MAVPYTVFSMDRYKFRLTDDLGEEVCLLESAHPELSDKDRCSLASSIKSHIEGRGDYKEGFSLPKELMFSFCGQPVAFANGWYTTNKEELRDFEITAFREG